MLLTSLPQIGHAPIARLGTSLSSFHFAECSDLAREWGGARGGWGAGWAESGWMWGGGRARVRACGGGLGAMGRGIVGRWPGRITSPNGVVTPCARNFSLERILSKAVRLSSTPSPV